MREQDVRPLSQQPSTCCTQGADAPRLSLISASEASIWKTITIGEYKGVNAVRAALDASPCPIRLGDGGFSWEKVDLAKEICSALS
jgi:hypothetical protein